jgi:hypothetical protein
MILIAYILLGVREFKIKLLFYLYNFTRIHDFKIIHLKAEADPRPSKAGHLTRLDPNNFFFPE